LFDDREKFPEVAIEFGGKFLGKNVGSRRASGFGIGIELAIKIFLKAGNRHIKTEDLGRKAVFGAKFLGPRDAPLPFAGRGSPIGESGI
jgi:hypothetical protein